MEYNKLSQARSGSRIDAVNRRFSLLLRRLLRLPGFVEEADSRSKFKIHLEKVNHLGLTLLLFGGFLAGTLLMITAIKTDSSKVFFIGIALIPAAYLVQFIVSLVCNANLNLTFGPPIKLVSILAPEVLTVFNLIILIGYLLFGITSSAAAFDLSLQLGLMTVLGNLLMLALLFYSACLAANSGPLLGVMISHQDTPQSPAEYLFSVTLYFGRYFLALVPYCFLGSMLALVAGSAYVGIRILSGGPVLTDPLAFSVVGVGGGVAVLILILICLQPIVAHFGYLLIVSVADIGIVFFRVAGSAERIAVLSEQAMSAVVVEDLSEAED